MAGRLLCSDRIVFGFPVKFVVFIPIPTKAKNRPLKHGTEGRVTTMADCKWMLDEVCVNDQCPMCADFCPVADYPGVCRFEERGEDDG